MSQTLTRVSNEAIEFPLSATNPDGTPATITGAKVAILPKRRGPNAATVWTTAPFAAGKVDMRLAGPDADPTGATLIVPEAGGDLWALPLGITDYNPVKITRVYLLGGNPSGPPDAATVSYATTTALTAGLAGKQDAAGLDAAAAALVGNGASATRGALGAAFGRLLTPTTTKTATYTAAVGDLAMMNVAGGGTVLNLPAAPTDKAQVGYRAIGATTAVPLTVNRGGSDTIGTAGATSAIIPLADEFAVLQYDAANTRWLAVGNVKTLASQDGRYAPIDRFGLRKLLAKITYAEPLTMTVNAAPPTVTWSTSRTITAVLNRPDAHATMLGLASTTKFDPSTGKFFPGNATAGLDFILYGDTVEFAWVAQGTNAETFWIFVDGQPLSASSVHPSVSTASGGTYFGKLVFSTAGQRRITVYAGDINAWTSTSTPVTGYIAAAPRKPKVAIIGDSWAGGSGITSNDPLLQFTFPVTRVLGADVLQAGVGGSGYNTANAFGGATRQAQVAAFGTPDLIVFLGSRNDPLSGLQAAATSCFAAYASTYPSTPQIVFGPQPGSSAETVGSTFAGLIGAVQTAALGGTNVIAFHDLIGSAAGAPAAYSGGSTYAEGSLVSYLGAVWKWSNSGTTSGAPAGNPGATGRWIRQTWGLFGTGNAGTPASDGTRDVLLGSDGVHPTAAGSTALGLFIAQTIRDDILTLVA